jgi:hypothetical protein
MITTDCRILFSIELLHDYYNQQVEFNDLDIMPDEATALLFNGLKIICKKAGNRLVGLVEVNANKPKITIPPGTKLRFFIVVKNPWFLNISSLKFFNVENQVYYFTNKSGNEKDGKLYLSKPLPVYDPAKDYEMGLLVSQGTKIFEAIQPVAHTAPHPVTSAGFWRELTPARFPAHNPADHDDIRSGAIVFNSADGNMYEAVRVIPAANSVDFANTDFWRKVNELVYVSAEDLIVKTNEILDRRTENKIKEKISGVIDLFFEGTVPANYAMLDAAGLVNQRNYILRYKNRITTWKYISDFNTIEKITDNDGVYDFNPQLTSKTPIPLLSRPFQNFGLKKIASTITKDFIKCATHVIIPDQTNQSFNSEIHLNY